MLRRSVVTLAMVFVLIACIGHAQTVAIAQISGVVTDESGAALPGVEVQVTQTATGATRFVVTDARGAYVLPNLPIGPHKLEAKLQGFATHVQTGITLTVGATPVINVTLKISAVEETVTVTADSPLVEMRNTGVGTTVTEEQMVGLPLNGRQASQLIYLSGPAVDNGGSGALIGSQRQYPSAVAISVAGGTGNSTLYLVDGGYNNDPLNNIGQPMPFPEALQEFKLECGVRPARYGVYTGATVNAVTKSGSNAFHGDAFVFGRHHAFNSRGYFDIADDGLVRAQTGGTLGGPLIKNKLFFFAGPQITNERVRPTSADTFIPTTKMLAGDFTDVMSAPCQNGANRTLGAPFVGNRINSALFNPIALKIAALLPTGNTDPCGRTRFTVPNDSDEIQGVVRSDFQLTAAQKIFGRYYVANYDRQPSYDGTNLLEATGTGLGLGVDAESRRREPILVPKVTHSARPGQLAAHVERSGRERLFVHARPRPEFLQLERHERVGDARIPGQIHFHDTAIVGRHRLGARRPQRVVRRDVDSAVRGCGWAVPGEWHVFVQRHAGRRCNRPGPSRHGGFPARRAELVQSGRKPDCRRKDA
ncbi:MAG: hypothetical protein DMF97_18940, partial [Acidobacteria bacterium]